MGRHGLPIFQAAELEEEDLLAEDTPRDPGSTQGSRDPKGSQGTVERTSSTISLQLYIIFGHNGCRSRYSMIFPDFNL